jgi:hypothetical protein
MASAPAALVRSTSPGQEVLLEVNRLEAADLDEARLLADLARDHRPRRRPWRGMGSANIGAADDKRAAANAASPAPGMDRRRMFFSCCSTPRDLDMREEVPRCQDERDRTAAAFHGGDFRQARSGEGARDRPIAPKQPVPAFRRRRRQCLIARRAFRRVVGGGGTGAVGRGRQLRIAGGRRACARRRGRREGLLDHLKRINDIFYDQIRIADQKAAYIFTFMVAFLVTSAEGRDVFRIERYLTGDPLSGLLSGVLALGVLFTLIFAILVVLPRHRATGTSLYWGGWPQNRALLLAAREHGDPEWVFQEYLGNVDNLSAINRAKYRYVSWSFRGLLVTVVAYCLLLAWGTAAGTA